MDKRTLELGWNKKQSKAIQGICAVGIIFHHMAQKTCASWIPQEYVTHGLEPFLNLGFLFVGVFFFCSGYGLYQSIKSNPDYLKGFIGKHFRPIVLLYLISNYCFFMIGQTLNNYTWFIYAILYLYLAFYISFSKCKTEKSSIVLLTSFVLLYILICEFLVTGSWCYNTVFLFPIGLIFSKDVEKIIQFIKKKYFFCLLITIICLIITFTAAIFLNNKIFSAETKIAYTIIRFAALIMQFASSISFTVFLFIISQKVNFNNKILVFLGSISLELYLIHVLFVEMFGYCFVYLDNEQNWYIENLFLYIIAVVSSSLLSAYALMLIKKGAHYLYNKFINIFNAITRDFIKVLDGLFILLIVITASLMIGDRLKLLTRNERINQYKEQNITFIQADNSNFSIYQKGHGEKTIIIIKGIYDPCPTLSQKALADELSKEYKVVLIDTPGSGFSSDFTTKRSVQNICREIHSVTNELGLNKYILLSEGISSLYAQYYVNEYEDEVEAVISLDAEMTGLGRAALKQQRMNIFEYERLNRKKANLKYVASRIINTCCYKTFLWPLYQPLFALGVGQNDDDVAYSVFFNRWENSAIRNERLCEINNYFETEDLKYPAKIKVIDFVSEQRRKSYEKREIDIFDYLNDICESNENHIIIILIDSIYCATNNPEVIKRLLVENL